MEVQTASAFLADLQQRDVKLWLEGERLRVNAPAGTLTPALQSELVRHKPEIIELLHVADANASSTRSISRVRRDVPLPLSSSQQRLWFLDQFDPGSAAYNIPIAMRLRGKLNIAVLQQSLDEVVRRHEALRTRFTMLDGQPVQVVEESARLVLERVDLSHLDEGERETEALRLGRQIAARPFDLTQAPLIRGALIRLADGDHVLATVVHHIAADGWSLGILGRELPTLYDAFVAGRSSPLAPLPIQYADYAVWERQNLEDAHVHRQLEHWTATLSGTLPVLELPTDYPRPARRSSHGNRLCHTFDPTLVETIKAFSRAENVTPYMVLLAAFKTLLLRLTHQEDIIVGTPVANRRHVETEGLVGLFINNLALRTDLSGEPTVRDLLQRVRNVALDAFANQDTPFEKLVEVLQPERDASRLPLFQVVFSLQNVPLQEPRLGDLSIDVIPMTETTRYDLTFELYERPHGMEVWVEYSTDLFDAGSIERLTRHYEALVRGMIAAPEQRIVDLPLLSDAERKQLIVDWNQTEVAYPQQAVHQLFEAQVARTPEAIAAMFEDQHISYAELNARSNQLARHLQSLGVGPETIVGVYLERSLDMLVGLLGILKAGGAYLPLDPLFPPHRLAYMLSDSHAPVLVTQMSLSKTLEIEDANVVRLDAEWERIAAQPSTNLNEPCDGERLAYVLYTSGSTGRPKGVQVVQRGLVNLLWSMRERPGFAASDVLLSVTTLSFDIAGLELFLPLIVGGRVLLVSSAVAADGERLLRVLHDSSATVMQATPATWRILVAAGWESTPSLRVLCGGEAMPRELASQLLARAGSVWNLYGPTETTIWSTIHEVVSIDENSVSIGRPISNTQAYVLDARQHPVPTGVAGELYLSGDGLARGYLNQPELTEAKFVANPFVGQPWVRMYRTGDMVRYRPDGTLEYLERADSQVKLRGYRIELGEIESLLEQQPSVRQSVVVVREDALGDKRLVGYVVPASGASLDVSLLRTALREALPAYMVPATLTMLDSLPLTPNGKVDRRALPLLGQVATETRREVAPPRDPVQRQIAAIWQDTLGVESVGVNDNFFDLGGHSLSIVKVHARIRATFDTDLSVAEMFQFPTIEELAVRVQRVSQLSRRVERAYGRIKRLRDESWPSPSAAPERHMQT